MEQLYAAVDMGSNSFKLLIVRSDPTTTRFLPVLRLNYPVFLPSLSSTISPAAELRAVSALRHFHLLLSSHNVPPSHTRHVATSAIRHDPDFIHSLHQTLGSTFHIDVLSGEEEARLAYLGVLQFHPIFNINALIIDIGGGSTEFVLGNGGKVIFGISLLLGHVALTQEFVQSNKIGQMREHIRSVIRQSGLIQELDKHGFEVVIGSSGTSRAVEKAIYNGYGKELNVRNDLNLHGEYKRDWKFSKGDLSDLVERVCLEDGELEREKVFKKRSEFIVAGAVLLDEIFGMLKIEGMEVSCYSLCEGVIAEKLAGSLENYDLNANARWRSVVCLASRFNSKKKIKSAALCAAIAKEMFESVRIWNEGCDSGNRLGVLLDDMDLEYLEAACLLHSIGYITGKKGYHKQSYHIVMNGGHLHGYNLEEITKLQIIALLCKHHRKKFPKLDHHSLKGLKKEAKQKFRILCAIIRVSVVLEQYIPVNILNIKVSHSQESFKLVLGELSDQLFVPGAAQALPEGADGEITRELEIFYAVFHQKLTVIVPSSSLESSKGQVS